MKNPAQLLEALAPLFAEHDSPAITDALKAMETQSKVMAEALVRQNAETMIRFQQVALEMVAGERAFMESVLNKQLAFLAVAQPRPRDTFGRAAPPQRSVNVPSPGQKSSSSAENVAAPFVTPAPQGSESFQHGRPDTDDEEVVVLADLDPFGLASGQPGHGAGFRPQT